MVVVCADAVVDGDDALMTIIYLECDAAVQVDEDDGDGCRLTHVQVIMTLEVLTSCIYRLEIISPCHAEKPIPPRPGCVLQPV